MVFSQRAREMEKSGQTHTQIYTQKDRQTTETQTDTDRHRQAQTDTDRQTESQVKGHLPRMLRMSAG